jgi:hypothetical protein
VTDVTRDVTTYTIKGVLRDDPDVSHVEVKFFLKLGKTSAGLDSLFTQRALLEFVYEHLTSWAAHVRDCCMKVF